MSAQSSPTTQRAVVAGRVVEGSARTGLPGVQVSIVGDSARVMSDSVGNFVLATTARGAATVMLRKIGYGPITVPIEVSAGDSLPLATAMHKAVTNLDTLKVVGAAARVAPARLEGFERRREHNRGGVFITPEQLEKTGSTSIVDMLRAIPSIRVMDASFGKLVVQSARGGRLDASGRPVPCRIRVMVDGFVMPITERSNTKGGMSLSEGGMPVDQEIPLPVTSPKLVHGIEVYAGPASMPRDLIPQGEDAFCGLIAIWTK